MTGTIINVVTVLAGGLLGVLLGNRLSEKARETVMHGLGLATLAIGMQLTLSQLTAAETSLKRLTFVVVLASILIGGLIGEMLDLERRLDAAGRWLEARTAYLGARGAPQGGSAPSLSLFSRGFVTASLVFCVGPMAIIGPIRDGLSGDFTLLAVKSVLDAFAALAFASSLGIGVLFSSLTVLLYQGSLALGARWISSALTDVMIAEMSATGGLLMLGIGLMLLEIKRVRVANLLPAIFIAPLLVIAALPVVPLLG